MPTFDVVSKIDLAEVNNAVSNLLREIEQRYDFKGSHCEVVLNKDTITVNADDDLKLRQIHEILKGHLSKRNIDAGVLDFKKVDQAAGQAVRQDIALIQGIDKDLSKNIIKEIKNAKIKVQVSIQGDELRVTGKKRDDLQDAISVLKEKEFILPLQFINFRD
ncbi:MAG: YajQ family cyclic di-GMP-binding protein [Rhodobiaceae bacterium]|nr:YajQ family cyclic di-GMP-binding protein [Rhodobiaceae bacterium]MBT5640108.1 YajQ family cyclic di-GMP-binding protein [Rhodobiaceae bacterium]